MSSRSAWGREQNNTMPGTSRAVQKAEARYNVTTEYPHYDLHFAAASGNLGLVEYALAHGQPVNSVLNGVLPLHAACAGGSAVVVRYLIEEGADVNAPRVPRRLSSNSERGVIGIGGIGSGGAGGGRGGVAVGVSGSTPLHFAAANGHIAVCTILLEHGAHPDRADKHGITPEMLARENGWLECAELIERWAGGRRGDLPPLPIMSATSGFSGMSTIGANASADRNGGAGEEDGSGGSTEGEDRDTFGKCEIAESVSRRLHLKRSVDNALHLFKSPLHGHQSSNQQHPQQQPSGQEHKPHHHLFHHSSVGRLRAPGSQSSANNSNAATPPSPSSAKPLGEYTFYPTSTESADVSSYRRPSLPHIFPEPASPFQRRSSGGKHSRRPRSAGTGAGVDQNQAQITTGAPVSGEIGGGAATPNSGIGGGAPTVSTGPGAQRRVGSKISLRNLFRRANSEAHGSSPSPSPSPADFESVISGAIPISMTTRALSLPGASVDSSPARSHSSSPPSRPPFYSQHQTSHYRQSNNNSIALATSMNSMTISEASSSSITPPASPLTASPSPMVAGGVRYRAPTAVELHHRYSAERLKEQVPSSPAAENEDGTALVRPSILRGHNRSSSSQSSTANNSPLTPNGGRTLRFDSPPNPEVTNDMPNTAVGTIGLRGLVGRRLKSSRSTSSLRHGESIDVGEEEDDFIITHAPADYEGDGEDESGSAVLTSPEYVYRPVGRPRGPSFASSTSSISPGLSTDGSSAGYMMIEHTYSIDRTQLSPISGTSASLTNDGSSDDRADLADVDSPQGRDNQQVPEGRARGHSISSAETDGSASYNEASQSSSASAFASFTTSSPENLPSATSTRAPALPLTSTSDNKKKDSFYDIDSPNSSLGDLGVQVVSSISAMRSTGKHTPLDLRGISNHAEAEALLMRTQQQLLESAILAAEDSNSPNVPLSAQLEAYGELLALERRFARGERQREQWSHRSDSEDDGALPKVPRSASYTKSDFGTVKARQGSSSRPRIGGTTSAGITPKSAKHRHGGSSPLRLKRPHTAEGASKASWGNSSSTALEAKSAFETPVSTSPASIRVKHNQSQSASTPLQVVPARNGFSNAEIKIVQINPTPTASPKTPEVAAPKSASFIPDVRPSLPIRSRTPDPEIPVDAYTTGIPLVRVSTAPLSDSRTGITPSSRFDPASRRIGGAQKLARMGFAPDAHNYSPPSSNSTSRSPSKARFVGIKSLVHSLKGKS